MRKVIRRMKNLKALGIVLIVLSFLLWLALPFIPMFPVSLKLKGIITGSILVIAEVFFWGGGVIVGKEVLKKYNLFQRAYHFIKNKFGKLFSKAEDS